MRVESDRPRLQLCGWDLRHVPCDTAWTLERGDQELCFESFSDSIEFVDHKLFLLLDENVQRNFSRLYFTKDPFEERRENRVFHNVRNHLEQVVAKLCCNDLFALASRYFFRLSSAMIAARVADVPIPSPSLRNFLL